MFSVFFTLEAGAPLAGVVAVPLAAPRAVAESKHNDTRTISQENLRHNM